MFDQIIDIVVSDRNSSEKFVELDKEIRDYHVSRFSPSIVQNIMCDITKQSKLNRFNYTSYGYDEKYETFVQCENFPENDENENQSPFNIGYINNMLYLDMINIEDLAEYLSLNLDCGIVAIPVRHSYTENKKMSEYGHISVMIYDNKTGFVYHVDSNGWKDDKQYNILENFIEQNISMLNGFGLNYTYLKCKEWNNENIGLNVNYHHKELNDAGNCMTWTILFVNLIEKALLSPYDLYDNLEKLDYEEKIYVLKTYGDILLNKYLVGKHIK